MGSSDTATAAAAANRTSVAGSVRFEVQHAQQFNVVVADNINALGGLLAMASHTAMLRSYRRGSRRSSDLV
jgi:hypothetical protein